MGTQVERDVGVVDSLVVEVLQQPVSGGGGGHRDAGARGVARVGAIGQVRIFAAVDDAVPAAALDEDRVGGSGGEDKDLRLLVGTGREGEGGGAHGRGLDRLRVRQRDRGAGHPRTGLGAALSAALGIVGAGGRGARQGQGRGRGHHCGKREEGCAAGA